MVSQSFDYDGNGCDMNEFKIIYQTLVINNPDKYVFSIREAASKLKVSAEFIRRRIKSGRISAVYFGDKPFIQITELAKLITEGIK